MPDLLSSQTPYCGAPPSPESLWGRWNLDPVLIGFLCAALAIYWVGTLRERPTPDLEAVWRRGAFTAGWAIASGALISPLCALSVSLFSARVGQHMILTLIAAPLVLLGRPGRALSAIWPHLGHRLSGSRLAEAMRSPVSSATIFALALWFWHAPGPYDATFTSPTIYWLMHLTIFGSALLIWNLLLDASAHRAAAVIAVGAVSTLQMTFLGALITMTPRLLYAPHALAPYAWRLTQASDQQLGGLIMWVPGCGVFLAVTLVALARVMREPIQSDALA